MTERFKRFNDRLEVSDLGNVKLDGQVIEKRQGKVYDYVCYNGRHYRVHVMVAEMFPEICGERHKWYHAHHKNRNQRDNRAVNIVWLSRSEHKRIHQLEDGVSRPVKAYKFDGERVEKIGEWSSKTEAAAATGVDYRHITEVILKKGRRFTAGGYWWFPADEPEENILKNIVELKSSKYGTLKKK